MSLENLNEQTHPEDYARARKMLEDCDWQLDRDDVAVYSVCEDVVISTMIHFRDSETEALAEEVRQLRAEREHTKERIEWVLGACEMDRDARNELGGLL